MKNRSVTLDRSLTALVIPVILAVLLAACGSPDATALRNTVWELESLTGNDVFPGTTITLEFSDDQVSGSAGCNQYLGAYEAGSKNLSITSVGSTLMACVRSDGTLDEGIMEQEKQYLKTLQAAATYQVTADRLEIFDETGTLILVFVTSAGGPTPQAGETPGQPGEPEMVEKLAPIDRVEILVAESFPPQYFVLVESGLPNGCVEFDRYEVTRDGDAIRVAVINLEPVGMECEDVYGTVEHNVPLGSDFDPGTTYTVLVNDVAETFVTESAAPAPDMDPTPTASSTSACAVRTDWFEHTVVHGDTLFNIAQRSGSSVDELAAANCLADASQIFVGQTLYVPNPIPADGSPPIEWVKFYLILPEDNGQSGPPVGCGDSAVAVWRDRTRTGSLAGDIQASLEELFSIKTAAYGKSGYTHSLHDADLTVQNVTVDDSTVVIGLTGTLQLVGVCADARMEAQILLTVFQYPGFDSALITVDGANLKQLFDASGTVGDDEPYRRSELAWPLPASSGDS
jgi:heat shock protein HslJ/LysM repeat protein